MTFGLGPLAAFLSSITWAIGSSGYSRMSREHSPFAVNFARALFALPLFVLAVFVTSGGWNEGVSSYQALQWSHFGWFGLSMFASYAMGDALFLWSTRDLGVPGALAIASSYPLWTALAGFLFRGEVLAPAQIAGLVLTLGGIVAVINPAAPTGIPGKGIVLALATSVMWSINSYAVSVGGQDLHPAVGNTVRMIFAMALCFGLSRFLARGRPLVLPRSLFGKFWWLFVLEAFFGSYFFMYGLSHSPLAIGAVLASLAPVISVPVAWVLGLEKPSVIRTLGVISVVFGLSLLVGTGL